jgi:hypothetical protein
MSRWSDLEDEMHELPLDPNTAERLIAGAIAPEDAPPGYANVARLLEAVAGEASPEELVREPETVKIVAAAMRSPSHNHLASPKRSFMPSALTRPRMTAAAAAAALVCSASLAVAGALPGAAQDIASSMLEKVGISVPGPNENAGTHPNERGNSSTVAPSTAGEGAEISDLATTTDLTGLEKGAAISDLASGGKSQAAEHASSPGGAAVVETPNSGGAGTADMMSGGQSSNGTSTADTASNGHSSAGSGNRP